MGMTSPLDYSKEGNARGAYWHNHALKRNWLPGDHRTRCKCGWFWFANDATHRLVCYGVHMESVARIIAAAKHQGGLGRYGNAAWDDGPDASLGHVRFSAQGARVFEKSYGVPAGTFRPAVGHTLAEANAAWAVGQALRSPSKEQR